MLRAAAGRKHQGARVIVGEDGREHEAVAFARVARVLPFELLRARFVFWRGVARTFRRIRQLIERPMDGLEDGLLLRDDRIVRDEEVVFVAATELEAAGGKLDARRRQP